MTNLRKTIILTAVAILNPLSSYADDIRDTIQILSGIRGADMTIYNLYRENLDADREKSMEYAEMFLSGIDTTSSEPILAEISDNIADWYEYDMSQFSEAIRWRSYSLRIYIAAKDSYMTALTRYRLSREYTNLGQYHNTLKYVSSALRYFEDTRDIPNLIECYNMLGIVYFTCRQYDKAFKWFTRYTDGARETGDTSKMVLGLNNSAVLAYTLRDTLKAQKLISESGFLSSAIRDTSKLCKVYLNNISLYLLTGDLKSAARTLEDVRPLIRKTDEKGQYYQNEGLFQVASGNLEKGIEALEKSIEAFSHGEYGNKIQHCYGILQKVYALEGDYRNAYMALSRYYEEDIRNRNDTIFLDLYKVQTELELSREKEQMARRQNSIILGSAIGILLLICITILLHGKSRRKSLEIRQKEEKIASQDEIIELRKMHEYQIGKMTEEISKELMALNSEVKDHSTREKIYAICRELMKSKDQSGWKEMSRFIPAFNSDFYQRLIADFPTLSVNERRLCALLNMNMTTKEISEITRQSTHSINIARARLRSKFDLTGKNITIQEFLSKYSQQG